MTKIDSEMTTWRKKIKNLQTDRGIGNSEGCFKCEHWESCHKSMKIPEEQVIKGDWTYVGYQYGEASVNGKKAKILFVSMDRGYSEGRCEKFEDTQVSFRTSALKRPNPHMGGVDVELEHLLDEGTSPEIRCQQFALTNAVHCCPYSEEAMVSQSTPTMKQNCEHHTKAIIQVLEPDIIIAQGRQPRDSMCNLFDLDIVESYHNERTGRSFRSVEIAKKEIGVDKQALFLLTGHPARYPGFGWRHGYLPDELEKAFKLARNIYAGTDNDVAHSQDKAAILPATQGAKKIVMPDRLFNTNERHAPGAYKKMFDRGVIAIYGYFDGPKKLEGGIEGQRVFAYVNGKGILAVGYIADSQPVHINTVFLGEEFHVKVDWETIVADDQGVTKKEVRDQHDYGLPVRGNPFCKLYCSSEVTDWIADELQRRAE